MRLPVLIAGLALAGVAQAEPIMVSDAWVRTPPPGAPTAAAYATLTVRSGGSDRLVGASSPLARSVELHEMTMAGGVMRMRPVVGGAPVVRGRPLRLAPGGLHLMLITPAHPLHSGERVPVTLKFARAGSERAVFIVGGAAPVRR